MPTTYTTLLGLAKPATGELSGTWGDTVNSYITDYVDSAVAGAQIISGSQTAVTLSTTNGSALSQAGAGATGSAQYAIIRCTGNPASLLTITAPAANKVYLVINATSTSQSVKVVGTGPTTGVTVAASRAALIAWNGSDFVLIATTDITQLSGTLAVANGGTGVTTSTGSGSNVLSNSPTLVTPTLGAASATSVALAAGAAGTPSLTATGDTDTGFWFPAANTLAASTGGSERLRIDSSGNVGIGTASPTDNLDVVGTETASNVSIFARNLATTTNSNSRLGLRGNNDAVRATFLLDGLGTVFTTGGILYTETNHPLLFGTNSVERVRIDTSGKVGIGTASPTYALDVQTSTSVTQARFGASATGGATILSAAGSQGIWCGGCDYNGTAFVARATTSSQMRTDSGLISFFTNSSLTSGNTFTPTERMRITSAGELLIGTTTVNSLLTVEGSGYFNQTSAGDGLTVRVNSGGTGQGGQIKMTNTYAGVPNSQKWLRVEDSGEWQIVNNAYSAVIMRVTDAGAAYKGDNTSTWSTTSDIRIKTNVRQIGSALDKMLALKPCHFEYKNAIGKTITGFIAQEFEQVFPGHVQESPAPMQFQEYVDEQNPNLKSIDPNIVPYLVAAMQEQQAIIKSLTDRIAALEAKGA